MLCQDTSARAEPVGTRQHGYRVKRVQYFKKRSMTQSWTERSEKRAALADQTSTWYMYKSKRNK